jgi:hypothetical protein
METAADPFVVSDSKTPTDMFRKRISKVFESSLQSDRSGTFFSRPVHYRVPNDHREFRRVEMSYFAERVTHRGSDQFSLVYEQPVLIIVLPQVDNRPIDTMKCSFVHLESRVRVVVAVESFTESIYVIRPNSWPNRYGSDDVIELPEVFPGFSLPGKQFFG